MGATQVPCIDSSSAIVFFLPSLAPLGSFHQARRPALRRSRASKRASPDAGQRLARALSLPRQHHIAVAEELIIVDLDRVDRAMLVKYQELAGVDAELLPFACVRFPLVPKALI